MIMLKQMIVMALLMVVGIIARKKDIINKSNMKQFSAIVVNISNPALILAGCCSQEEKIAGTSFVGIILFAVLLYVSLLIVAEIVVILFHIDRSIRGIYKLQMIFSNIGFMGVPLVSAVFGKQAVLYITVFLIPYNILIYSYGIRTLIKSADAGSRAPRMRDTIKNIFNTGLLAGCLSLFIYATGIQLPGLICETIEMISSTAAPLAMMIIGASLIDLKWKDLISDFKLLGFLVFKLVVFPIISLLILRRFITDVNLLGAVLVILGTPVGSLVAMLAKQYGSEKVENIATKAIALSTIMSVITISIVYSVILP